MIFGSFFIVDCSDCELVAAVAAAVLPPLQMSLLQLEALSRLNSRRSIIPGKTLFLHEVYRSRKEMWMLWRDVVPLCDLVYCTLGTRKIGSLC